MNWTFFENLDDLVAVTDVEQHTLVYLNKRAREIFGVGDDVDYVGHTCYEMLYGSSIPCPHCNVECMREGDVDLHPLHLPSLGRTYQSQTTLVREGGRLSRVELCNIRNVTPSAIQGADYQSLESMANEAFRASLNSTTPDEAIHSILAFLGGALHGERTYIFERNRKGNDDNTYEWCADGVEPVIQRLQDLPAEVCAVWYKHFGVNNIVMYADVESFRESDPLQYENLKSQGIRSIVTVPLYDNSRILGFYGVDNPPPEGLQSVSNLLQIVAHFIVAQMRQRDLIRQLQIMSHQDPLTGLGNRYAMEETIESLHSDRSLSVVYCDVTGLKRINDTEGHQQGDQLILRACACLERAFGRNWLFRIGGDELLVLRPDIGEESLLKQISLLQEDTKAHDVNLAIGYAWSPTSPSNIDSMLSVAEEMMYKNKAEWYRQSGMDRRH